jgi:hypothetical protein
MSNVPARRDGVPPSFQLRLVRFGDQWVPSPPLPKKRKRSKIKIKGRRYRLRDLTQRVLNSLVEHPITDSYYDSGPDDPLVVIKSSTDGIVAHVTKDEFEARLARHFDFVQLNDDKEWEPVRTLPAGLARDIVGLKSGLSDYFPDAKTGMDVAKHGQFILWLVARIHKYGRYPQQLQFYCDSILATARKETVQQKPRTNESCGKLLRRLDRTGFWTANDIDFTAFDHDAGGSRYGATWFPSDEPSVVTAKATVVSDADDGSDPDGVEVLPAPDLTNPPTWEDDQQ